MPAVALLTIRDPGKVLDSPLTPYLGTRVCVLWVRRPEAGCCRKSPESLYSLIMSDSATPWTVVRQAPLSMGFFRYEYWSRLPCLSPEDLPNPGIVSCIGRWVLYH